MRLIVQPNLWSCSAASLAMLLDVSYEEVVEAFGFDGSQQWWPLEPLGFPTPEIIDTAFDSFGVALVSFDLSPGIINKDRTKESVLYNDDYINARMDKLLVGHSGLIIGCYAIDKYHMVAWDGKQIYDPQGRVYGLDDPNVIIMDRFLMAIPGQPKGLLAGIKSYSRFAK